MSWDVCAVDGDAKTPGERSERARERRQRQATRAARALAAMAVAAVLLVVRPGSAKADAYDYIAAAAMETSGDAAKLREGWTEALGNLDAIPKARRKPLHCYWRSLLLYRLGSVDKADDARTACTGELLRATAPAADKRADAINNLAHEGAAAARRSAQALLSQRTEDLHEQLGELSGCQLALEAEHGRLEATTKDLRSLQKRLGDLTLGVRELTSDPEVRKRIESVASLKAVKGQLDRAAAGTGAQ